jgi:four helix bundle protein
LQFDIFRQKFDFMNSEELKARTKKFSHRIVRLSNALPNTVLGNYLSSQLIRSALSVASNYRATCVAQSKKQFIAKLSIVLEECDESLFWIEFVEDENLLPAAQIQNIKDETEQLLKIFKASRLTAKGKPKPAKSNKKINDNSKT